MVKVAAIGAGGACTDTVLTCSCELALTPHLGPTGLTPAKHLGKTLQEMEPHLHDISRCMAPQINDVACCVMRCLLLPASARHHMHDD